MGKRRIKIFTLVVLVLTTMSLQAQRFDEVIHEGEGTYYDFEQFGGFGNCSFDDEKIRPFLIGAMNEQDYGQADYCGACVEITGPEGMVTVQIIDRCPECAPGDIDLSPEAFEYLAPIIDGRIPISWHVVPCEVSDNIVLYYKEGSTQWWTAIQIRYHRNPIATVELYDGSEYITLERMRYNYFLKEDESGFGTAPHTFRITDVYGNVIIEEVSEMVVEQEIEGSSQFPTEDGTVTSNVKNLKKEPKVFIANGKIVLQNIEGKIEMYDLTGKRVFSAQSSENLNIEYLNDGLYLVKVQGGGKALFNKVLKR